MLDFLYSYLAASLFVLSFGCLLGTCSFYSYLGAGSVYSHLDACSFYSHLDDGSVYSHLDACSLYSHLDAGSVYSHLYACSFYSHLGAIKLVIYCCYSLARSFIRTQKEQLSIHCERNSKTISPSGSRKFAFKFGNNRNSLF